MTFPVLLDFRVDRYPLYPGRDGQGLHFALPPGVSIIAGINGLGKTTLLNVLFRVLTGPVEWRKRRVGELAGSSGIDLGRWRGADYFKNRVPNAARGATVSATIGFGDRRLHVTRSLETLGVLELSIDGSALNADQGDYQAAVCELAGLEQFSDFFLLVRYLVFFLEERQPLVWDPDAQMDALRFLFFNSAAAAEVRKRFDDIQKEDSEYRNLRYQLGKLKDRLMRQQAESEGSEEVVSLISSLTTKYRALEDEELQLGGQIQESDGARRTQRLKLEQAKVHLAELQRAYAEAEGVHFATLFPGTSEVAAQVLIQVGTGGGCLVCGNRSPSAVEHVRACAREGRCPVCDSTPAEQEGPPDRGRLSGKRLEALGRDVARAADAVQGLEGALSAASRRFEALAARSLEVRQAMLETEEQLRMQRASLPLGQEELEQLSRAVRTLDADLKRQRAKLTAMEEEYKEILSDGEIRVRAVAEEISRRFADFAQYFLADEADLEYGIDSRKIGEDTRRFDFPRFVVRLRAAGVEAAQPRRESFEVSESQKEFLDLAFRMALIEVAAAGSPSMLVLETPEASLDSVFMVRAGQLLGSYAAGGGGRNRLIATSNLTRGEMISALLGAVALPGDNPENLPHHIPENQREERVVNLLDDARPNAALVQYRSEYEQELQNALYPPARDGLGTDASRRRGSGGSPHSGARRGKAGTGRRLATAKKGKSSRRGAG